MKTLTCSILLCVATMCAGASTVDVTFLGPSTGANNGTDYVGPYDLTIDGAPVQGVCISWNLEVGPPYSWTATEIQLPGNYDPFLEAAWLTEQFNYIAPSDAGWSPTHQAIWDLFGASFNDPGTLAWIAQAENPANWGTINPADFVLLQPLQADYTQTFIVPVSTPEPATFLLIGFSLAVVGLTGKLRRSQVSDGA